MRRKALEALSRDALAGVTDRLGLPVEDRRAQAAHVEAILNVSGTPFGDILRLFSRADVKTICEALDLDTSGKEKEPIVQRILAAVEGRALTAPVPARAEPKPPRAAKGGKTNGSSGGDLGFERKLFQAADKLRNNMDAAEYKHVVLGLIFLKYISDAFEELHSRLVAETDQGADPESKDEYVAERVFWVPKESRWSNIQANAKQAGIGQLIDDAMVAIEHDNPSLKGVLAKNYGRPQLDKQRLGELVDLISTIGFGSEEHRSKDILGRVYEYFLGEFALAEGRKGGQFYTPRSVVHTLVEMLAPYKGRVYDPCFGSGGMFVQSESFVEQHRGRIGDISIYG
jgi:type I restriction enzyme M protein